MNDFVRVSLTMTSIWTIPAIAYAATRLDSKPDKICGIVFFIYSFAVVLSWVVTFIEFVWSY